MYQHRLPIPMEDDRPILMEAPGFIRIYHDGSFSRLVDRETAPVPSSSEDDNFDEEKEGVASKDVVIDPQTGVFVRIYLPRLEVTSGKQKVPVLVYAHGGGFCIGSVASPIYHRYLNIVAAEAKVICVSVDYRKAREHLLPACYDDCFGALEWLDRQALALEGVSVDPWLASHADFSNVFLAGDCAGANILHQVGVRASGRSWDGVRLQGAILVHPLFGGHDRIGCETLPGEEVLASNILVDLIWSFSLRDYGDHPFRNPLGYAAPALSTLVYPRTLVFVARKDHLRDRGILYYESIKNAGKDAELVMTEGEGHVFHLFNPKSENASLMLKRISDFIHSPSDQPNLQLSFTTCVSEAAVKEN